VIKEKGGNEVRYNKLHNNLEEGKVFEREGTVVWKCQNGGYLYEGEKTTFNFHFSSAL